jgi:hypothetical protein
MQENEELAAPFDCVVRKHYIARRQPQAPSTTTFDTYPQDEK